jgi:flagellar FliL protein
VAVSYNLSSHSIGISVAQLAAQMNMKIIVIAGALTAVLGGVAAVYFVFPGVIPGTAKPKEQDAHKEAKVEEKKREPEVGADLDVFVVNLSGPGPSRYLRTTLSLGVKSEKEKELIKEASGPIRDAVIMYLSQRKVEELLDSNGKTKLRTDLNNEVNNAIGSRIVSNVYFKEFLIQ